MGSSMGILSAIGNTPLVKLDRITKGTNITIYVKAEFVNPSGSIKDRVAFQMLTEGEQAGKLKPGYTVVEATTGNMGIALSFLTAVKGYKMVVYAPEGDVYNERIGIMKSYGAEAVRMDVSATAEAFHGLPQAIRKERSVHGGYVELLPRLKCKELEETRPDIFWPRQYQTIANVRAHRDGTGREIIQQLKGVRPNAFVASIGTGGTILGAGQALKAEYPELKVVSLEPASNSILKLGKDLVLVEGATDGIIKDIIDQGIRKEGSVIDEMLDITNDDAVEMAARLASEEGLFCGMSSGANVLGALKVGERLGSGSVIVTVLPDNRDRYLKDQYYIT